jgi:hypothetical protein
VTKECFLSNAVNRSDTEDSDEEMQMHSEMSQEVEDLDACIAESLFIPDIIHDEEGNGEPLQNGGRKVANCCAICLCEYEINENIVWSNNKACKHAFHDCCILEYLQNKQKEFPCPCCRLPFSDLLEKGEQIETFTGSETEIESDIEIESDSETGSTSTHSQFPHFVVRMLHRARYLTVNASDPVTATTSV